MSQNYLLIILNGKKKNQTLMKSLYKIYDENSNNEYIYEVDVKYPR